MFCFTGLPKACQVPADWLITLFAHSDWSTLIMTSSKRIISKKIHIKFRNAPFGASLCFDVTSHIFDQSERRKSRIIGDFVRLFHCCTCHFCHWNEIGARTGNRQKQQHSRYFDSPNLLIYNLVNTEPCR